jgi:hypothetical protein
MSERLAKATYSSGPARRSAGSETHPPPSPPELLGALLFGLVRWLSPWELQCAAGYILAVQLLRTTCHLSWMLVIAWSQQSLVLVSHSCDHTVPGTRSEIALRRTNCSRRSQ